MAYDREPTLMPGPGKIGILLANLGTPDTPTPSAVRRYLKEFLSDPRVVEIPKLLWWPILNGIILNTRPRASAHKYASIWMAEGSPLRVWTEKQGKLLKGMLGEKYGNTVRVAWAMRYGKPAIADVMQTLKAEGCDRVLVVPLYPQYSSSTTASVVDEIGRTLARWRRQPGLRIVQSFHDDPGYIAALAQRVRQHWQQNGRGDHLLMSFHGIPQRSSQLGDPYEQHCHQTANLLAAELNLTERDYTVSFQSRFGPARWLQPYTSETLLQLGRKKIGTLDVMCPGFTSDCLETLEEIALEGKAEFHKADGKNYRYIPCLNDSPAWLAALDRLAERELQGWLVDKPLASPGKN